jgi:hypothetical protein
MFVSVGGVVDTGFEVVVGFLVVGSGLLFWEEGAAGASTSEGFTKVLSPVSGERGFALDLVIGRLLPETEGGLHRKL